MKKITKALPGHGLSTLRSPERLHPNQFFRGLVAAGIGALACVNLAAHAGSVSYGYDALGRLASAVFSNGSSTTSITYSYDAAGNRTSVVTTSP